jgi:ATP-binding cassette subfamily F protein uup
MNYLSAENISKSFGELKLFEGVSFGLSRGDKTALIAKNGTGKTTLLRILMGKESADSGEFRFRKGVKTAFLEQSPELDGALSMDELIASTARTLAPAEPDSPDGWDYDRKLKQLLNLFRITDTSQRISTLSGGEKKRLALAIVLLDEPDLLILDEPTNHLDIDMIEWLEGYLSTSKMTLLMVTHDRYFLDRVCNHIIELNRGQLYHYQGNYEYFLQKRAEQEELNQLEKDKAGQLMKKELEWLRRSPKARTGKSKSRIGAFEAIQEKAMQAEDNSELRLQVKIPRLGGKILELEDLKKSYGSLKIIGKFSYTFAKGDRIGIIGKNGTGKTTFLDVISGRETQDEGTIDRGETVVISYYRQSGITWKQDQRVIDVVKEIAEVVQLENGRTISASQFLEHFMFTPEAQYKLISKLSGGEQRRLHLLTVLIKNPNFLILDEPTNDLDLFALNKLEEFLLNFKGCLVIVSHDRYFLDKLTDHLFIFEGAGKIRDHYGKYSDYKSGTKGKKATSKTAGEKTSPKTAGRRQEKDNGEVRSSRTSRAKKTKLSFKEQQEYKQLEPEIEKLEQEKSALEAELNAGTLDYASLQEKSQRIADLIRLIDEKVQRWMELSEFV